MRNRVIFVSIIAIYILKEIIFLYLNLDIKTNISKRDDNIGDIANISLYNQDFNTSYLSNNQVWGLAKYEKPKPKIVDKNISDNNKSNESNEIVFKLRDKDGFYTIIIDKKEFDFLGVGERNSTLFALFYDNSQKKNRDALKEYIKGDNIYKDIKLQKIGSDFLRLIDTSTYKKIIIPYFLVKENEFKPEGNISEY